MATRSMIGIENKDGTIKAVYCHWDGYPANNGMLLHSHYNDEATILQLISMGDLSSLRKYIGEKTDMGDLDPNRPAVVNEWCEFYGRDRGDEGCGTRDYPNRSQFMEAANGCWADWVYLYDAANGEWLIHDTDENSSWRTVRRELESLGLIDPLDHLLHKAKRATA